MAWNSHALIAGIIGCVNPMRSISIQHATGYTVNTDGTQVPTYTTVTGNAQIQTLSTGEIRHMLGLNISGVTKKMFVAGAISSIVRENSKGGDIITFDDGTVWLTTVILEQWPDWVCVGLRQQLQ
jgi:hypothetical protein